jgi:hypothetical protein
MKDSVCLLAKVNVQRKNQKIKKTKVVLLSSIEYYEKIYTSNRFIGIKHNTIGLM